MLTVSALREQPKLLDAYEGVDFLAPIPVGGAEEVVRDTSGDTDAGTPPATMVFMHETIAMMRAERADQIEKLSAVIDEAGELLPLKKKPESLWDHITLGRATSADLVVGDPAVSSVHAHFALDVDEHPVSVQDVGSSNGTFINRTQLQPHKLAKLRAGDCVRFGQSIFYYISGALLREMVAGR
ncbi:MAG: FHA domain-containing protein [Myxococcota bacterium]